MSVLIKGFEMPKRCADCPIYFAGLCSVRLQNGKCPLDGRPDWCPLVEMKEKSAKEVAQACGAISMHQIASYLPSFKYFAEAGFKFFKEER